MVDERPEQTGSSPGVGPNFEPNLEPNLGLEGAADLGRPKRAPPTIDLHATDITGAAETGAASSARSAAESSAAESSAAKSSDAQAEAAAAAEASRSNDAIEAPGKESTPRPRRTATVLIAAISGAIAAALLMVVAELAGWPIQGGAPENPAPQISSAEVSRPEVSGAAFESLSARVAKVEARPAASTANAAPATPDPTIAARIDGLEKSIASLRGDLAAVRTQSDRAATAVSDLKSAPRETAPPVDLAPINERLGQIERTAGVLKTEAAQQSAKPADDKPLRRVVAASLLDGSVRLGEPYAAALTQAKSLAVDAASLKPLDAYAASGVPSASTLGRELSVLLPKLTSSGESAATAGSGFVDRLQAGAARLIRIQRTDAVAGVDRGAVVSRISAAANRNDLAEAKREVSALAPADRAMLQPWLDKVDARDAALAASRQFAADAMAALTKPAP